MRAFLPIKSATRQPAWLMASEFWPVCVATTLPSTTRLMQVSPGMIAAADQKADVRLPDGELGRDELADRHVRLGVGVGQAFALEALQELLRRGGPRRRAGAKCLAGGLPVAVGFALEIGEDLDASASGARGRKPSASSTHWPPRAARYSCFTPSLPA